jgi:hypothetical protein
MDGVPQVATALPLTLPSATDPLSASTAGFRSSERRPAGLRGAGFAMAIACKRARRRPPGPLARRRVSSIS